MRVLLVHPRAPDSFWSVDGALAPVGGEGLQPPLGLLILAARLPSHWQLRLVDRQIRPVRAAEWARAELVLLSGRSLHTRDLAAQIALARQWRLPVAVALGGPFVPSSPEAPGLAGADVLILDEGGISLAPFVAAVEAGQRSGRFGADGETPALGSSPLPRFDLLDLAAYDTMAVQLSPGCPLQLLAELAQLQALGWRGDVFLVDANAGGNHHSLRRLLAALVVWQRRHRYPFRFSTAASPDLASDRALLKAMVACRFRRVFLAIGMSDSSSRLEARKLQNSRATLLEAVETITCHGLQVMAGFRLGIDGESAGAAERIVAFVTAAAIPVTMLSMPSRPMAALAREFLGAFNRLHDPAAYLERVVRTCRRLPPPLPGGQRPPRQRLRRLRTVAILLWRQGVMRPSRGLFWRSLAEIVARRPALLEDFFWMITLEEHVLASSRCPAQTALMRQRSTARASSGSPRKRSSQGSPQGSTLAMPTRTPRP